MPSPKGNIVKALIVFSILVLLAINLTPRINSIRTKLIDVVNPPLTILRNIPSLFKRMLPFASLREENNALRQKIELLNRKLTEAGAVSAENQRLRDLLNFTRTLPCTTIPARVIGRDPTNWSNSVIIDKGANHGIRHNKAVLSTRGLVGRVIEVGRFSSKILLITDPNSKVGVLIQRNRQGGILAGRPDGRCKMIYISMDSDVSAGDKVITAGLGKIFPKDMPVGEVVKIGKEPGRLYKYAIIKTVDDLSRLEEVLCIR